MQSVGSKQMDAANLQLIIMNYLDPSGERAKGHLKAHEKALIKNDILFYRYLHDDLGEAHNSFVLCGFWYAEALAAASRTDKALDIISRLQKASNHLGLFSEDADEEFGQWGNFPQTYSHVGLVNAIYRVSTKLDKPIFL